MFGYITINKPELKIKEFDEYMAYYCGLCTALRKRYGFKGQLSLSYDLTFLAMLLTGLYDGRTEDESCKCIFHPMDKKRRKENKFLYYTAFLLLHKIPDRLCVIIKPYILGNTSFTVLGKNSGIGKNHKPPGKKHQKITLEKGV